MAAYILLILFIGVLMGVTLGIGYLCVEFVVRLIGRGLGIAAPTGVNRRRSSLA